MRKILKSTSKLIRPSIKPIFLTSSLKINSLVQTPPLLYKPIYNFSSSSEKAHKNISKSTFEGAGFYV